MTSWGGFIVVFVALWVMQIVLTAKQSNHFKQQFREMQQQQSGFLGVGVSKKRLGSGAVVIMVTDEHGIVTRCKQMAGVTVFAKFHELPGLTGKPYTECRVAAPTTPKQIALNMAIDKISQEQEKQQQHDQTELSAVQTG